MQERGYAKRSWALLTRDKGWFKPVLVLAAANLVPIAGALGTSGYMLEWARLTAWGIDAAPKQKNVQVGTCIRSGWRAFVVGLGWCACLALAMIIVNAAAEAIPGAIGTFIQFLVSVAIFAAQLLVTVALSIASTRTAIYERISAGYRVNRVFEMIRRDTTGFLHLVLFSFLWMLAMGVVTFVIALTAIMAFVPVMITAGSGLNEYAVLTALSQTIGFVVVVAIILGYGFSIVTTAYLMVFHNAVGLWMRQFDVPSWGRSEDPLPQSAPADDMPPAELPQLPQTTRGDAVEAKTNETVMIEQDVRPAPTPAVEDRSMDVPVADMQNPSIEVDDLGFARVAPEGDTIVRSHASQETAGVDKTENLNAHLAETAKLDRGDARDFAAPDVIEGDDISAKPSALDETEAPAKLDDREDDDLERGVDDLYDRLYDLMGRDEKETNED